MKRYLKINVYEAFLRRMSVITENFDNIIVAFSGGKDSGLLLHLVLLYLDQHKINIPVSIFHIDYEAQYTATTEFVDDVYSTLSGRIRPYRCCVPIKAGTCTSISCSFWRPWGPEARELWVRELPKNCYTVEHFLFYRSDMWDYEFQEKFSPWHHEYHGARRTGVLIGIRAQESLNRWRTITSERNINKFMGHS